jgi:LPS sulfotransferase NodH
MKAGSNIFWTLNDAIPDVYPDRSIHSLEIEKNMPIWDEAGRTDFSTMINNGVRVVFVCFINRSGSNYLLDLIQQLGLGAKPTDEVFNYDHVIERCRKNNISSFSAYLAKIVLANARNGFCFLKIGGEQLFWLAKHGFLSYMINSNCAPKFIFMSRTDKIAQAVSLFIAEATGRFSEFRTENNRPPGDEFKIDYDPAKILDRLRYVDYQEHLFSLFFTLHGIEFYSIRYETLDANPRNILQDMLQFVGAFEAGVSQISMIEARGQTVARQGGDLNRIFIDRFRRDFSLSQQQ